MLPGSHQQQPGERLPRGDVEFDSRSLLVIDEAGMLDTPSLYRLVGLLPQGARLLDSCPGALLQGEWLQTASMPASMPANR